jgi:hypothetical protein
MSLSTVDKRRNVKETNPLAFSVRVVSTMVSAQAGCKKTLPRT